MVDKKKPDPRERFVQPAEGIVVISSPGMTAAQIAALEKKRLAKLRASR